MAAVTSLANQQFDIVGDDIDGKIIYKCIVDGQSKIGKYEAMVVHGNR